MSIKITMPEEKVTFNRYERKNLKKFKAGVYFLYSKEWRLLYVGKSKNLRHRISSHLRGAGNSAEFYRQIYYLTIYKCEDDYERELYETFSINEYKPLYNRSKSYFNDTQIETELYEIDEKIFELEREKSEIIADMENDGLVERDFDEDRQYATGVYFRNQSLLKDLDDEIEQLNKEKGFLSLR